MTPPSTRFLLDANLRDIAEDDALLDALGARRTPDATSAEHTPSGGSRRVEARGVGAGDGHRASDPQAHVDAEDTVAGSRSHSASELALSALLDAWTREIDAECDGVDRPGRSALHAATRVQRDDRVDELAPRASVAPITGGRYLATGRPSRPGRSKRAWSSRASLTALSAGAVVALSSVAAAVNGHGLPSALSPVHLDWSEARAVAGSDVPHVRATTDPSVTITPTHVAGSPGASARPPADASHAPGAPRHEERGVPSVQAGEQPVRTEQRAGERGPVPDRTASAIDSIVAVHLPSSVEVAASSDGAPPHARYGSPSPRSPQTTTGPRPPWAASSSARPGTHPAPSRTSSSTHAPTTSHPRSSTNSPSTASPNSTSPSTKPSTSHKPSPSTSRHPTTPSTSTSSMKPRPSKSTSKPPKSTSSPRPSSTQSTPASTPPAPTPSSSPQAPSATSTPASEPTSPDARGATPASD